MRIESVRFTRVAMTAALGVSLTCALLAATASSALAGGNQGRDSYSVNISPSSVVAKSSTTFDVAFTNTSSPGLQLDSAVIVPPWGFRITGASLPTGSHGTAGVFWNAVFLNRLGLPPGSTLHVSVKATAPSRCSAHPRYWHTFANGTGFFAPVFQLDRGSSVATTVSCDMATALEFSGQPNNALVGQDITGSSYDTSGPPVTVKLVDSSGNTVDSSAPVTITLNDPPGGSGTLGGTATEDAVNGVATFSNLTVNQPDNDYTLQASSTGVPSATSNPFDANASATPCPAGATCTNTITSGSGQLEVDVGTGTTAATLTESVDVGTPMDGAGSDPEADPGCENYTPPEASADWYEFVVQPADGQTFDRSKTVTWTVNGASADGFEVCFGAPYEFDAQDTDSGLAPPGTLPDGTQGYVGLLEPCSDYTSGSPCIESIRDVAIPQTEGQSVVASVFIPAGLTGDPMMGR